MKKIAVVLLIMFLLVPGVNASKQFVINAEAPPPDQAGKSSIYILHVKSHVHDGYGQLMINVAKKTFVFNGMNFTPFGRFKIKIDRESGCELLADGHATRTGNLHIQGEWKPGDAIPEPGMVGTYWYYDPAYGFAGQQMGWYVANLKIRYSKDGGNTWLTTEKETGDVLWCETFKVTVAQFTDSTHVIKKGDLLQFKVTVIGGDDTCGPIQYLLMALMQTQCLAGLIYSHTGLHLTHGLSIGVMIVSVALIQLMILVTTGILGV